MLEKSLRTQVRTRWSCVPGPQGTAINGGAMAAVKTDRRRAYTEPEALAPPSLAHSASAS